MGKIEDLEGKIHAAAALIESLHRQNAELRREKETLQSHLSLFNDENSRAQKILADHEQLRKRHEAAALKIRRALGALNAMRSGG